MSARTFIWISIGGGAWSLAGNWDDQTDGVSPSGLLPGAQDDVVVPGPDGSTLQTLTGTGTVASAVFTGNTALSGSFSASTLNIGTTATSGLLQLVEGTQMQSSSASLLAGSLLVNGAGTTPAVAGTLVVGDGQEDGLSAGMNVTSGGAATVLSLLMNVANCQIYVDPTAVLEVGGLGTGQDGYLTVDPGAVLAGQGDANEYGAVANNGTIEATGGTLALGRLSGTGTLAIEAGAVLQLDGACGAGQSVDFAGANAVLDLVEEFYAPTGLVAGFAPGDAIDVSGSLISSAQFSANGTSGGTLTLYYGSQVAAGLSLAGNYTGYTFLTAGDGGGGTLITVAAAASGSGTASPGTSTPDQYLWVAPGSGQWNAVANWEDQTSGADPAAIAPGVHNIVSLATSQASFTVIAGPANAASLSLTGEVALSGAFGIGALDVGSVAGQTFIDGTLDLEPRTSITASAATVAAGNIAVAGSGAVLSVGGRLILGGGIPGVGLPVTALTVTSGGRVQVGTLSIGGGSGDSLTTDPTGSFEVGKLGGAAAGAVTVDKGAQLGGNGSVNPLGKVIDNGKILATGGVLTLGTVTGTGSLVISNGVLDLNAATAVPIIFSGNDATLAFAGTDACPTGTLSNMVQGDLIDIVGDPVTNAQFNTNPDLMSGTLVLAYGGTIVGQIAMTGNFTQDEFLNVPDGSGGTFVELAPNSGGGGGPGQSGTDQLAWTGALDGEWSVGGNWNDMTNGDAATLPPGAATPATVAGPSGAQFASISGTGACASLAMHGNVYLSGVFGTGAFTFGSDATASASAVGGTLATYPTATLTATSAFIADGAILPAASGVLISVSGTLTLGDGGGTPVMNVQAGAAVVAGALVLGGGTVSVDGFSSVEIGTLGTGAARTLTIDPGFAVSGDGTLNVLGAIADNGVMTAQGGTLVVGAVSGTGSIAIAAESALSLTGGETAPIDFTGAGGTLIIDTTADIPAGTITGFVPGESILITGSPVDTVNYAPGTGGVGTLTLSEAGMVAGTLLLAGNYAGDTFAVQPDGEGAAISVATGSGVGIGGPPPGTTTPDQYVWTGAGGALWSDAADWTDTSAGQSPAAVPPGQFDLVSIAGSPGTVQTITGPGDAVMLSLTGTVALNGGISAGMLAVGTAQQSDVLALGNGAAVAAGSAVVLGEVAGQGGTLSVAGVLTIGAAGVVDATGGSAVSAGTAVLQGAGSTLVTDATASIEIGGASGAVAGDVCIDAGGTLEGSGTVDPAGQVVVDGLVVAGGGTLTLGPVAGTGTLLVGLDATLLLEGTAGAGLVADFAGAGTLALADSGFDASVSDFGPSDTIILPVSGATSAEYAVEAPGVGVLTILAGSQVLQTLTLLGSVAGETFNVAGSAGGGTSLTASSANMASEGGYTVPSNSFVPGSNVLTAGQLQSLAESEFPYAATFVQDMDDNESCDLWYLDGESTVGAPLFGGPDQPAGVNVELIAPTEAGSGAPTNYVLQAGYSALVAEGTEPLNLFDQDVGHALLVGNDNSGVDGVVQPTELVTLASGDTLVGAVGGNTVFWASGGENVSIQGGGNDTIVTNEDNAMVTTSGGGRSVVFTGASDNLVVSQGSDAIVCGDTVGGNASDTIDAAGAPGRPGPTVFGPDSGSQVDVFGNASDPVVVGGGGQLSVHGGASNGNVVWAGTSNAFYFGGAGTAAVVGGSGYLDVVGGVAPLTVYGGTGPTFIEGATGNSEYLVGYGATQVAAGDGNLVFIVGSAPVTVAGAPGLVVYAGQASGAYIFNANAGSETLWGGAGTDQFNVGSGNDVIVSGGGADSFNFRNGLAGGNDSISNFNVRTDKIVLEGYGGGIPALSVQSGSTYFSLSDGTHVDVLGVTNLGASSFSIT